MQDSFSLLSAYRIFSITAPIRARCSSTMEALFSAVDKLPCTSGWTKVVGGVGSLPPDEGGCLPDPGASKVSGTVSGCGPNPRSSLPSTLMGAATPVYPAPEVCPPWSGSFWDDTSVSCPGFGEGAFGGVSLSRASELNESSDEDCSARDLAELQKVWRKLQYYTLMILDA